MKKRITTVLSMLLINTSSVFSGDIDPSLFPLHNTGPTMAQMHAGYGGNLKLGDTGDNVIVWRLLMASTGCIQTVAETTSIAVYDNNLYAATAYFQREVLKIETNDAGNRNGDTMLALALSEHVDTFINIINVFEMFKDYAPEKRLLIFQSIESSLITGEEYLTDNVMTKVSGIEQDDHEVLAAAEEFSGPVIEDDNSSDQSSLSFPDIEDDIIGQSPDRSDTTIVTEISDDSDSYTELSTEKADAYVQQAKKVTDEQPATVQRTTDNTTKPAIEGNPILTVDTAPKHETRTEAEILAASAASIPSNTPLKKNYMFVSAADKKKKADREAAALEKRNASNGFGESLPFFIFTAVMLVLGTALWYMFRNRKKEEDDLEISKNDPRRHIKWDGQEKIERKIIPTIALAASDEKIRTKLEQRLGPPTSAKNCMKLAKSGEQALQKKRPPVEHDLDKLFATVPKEDGVTPARRKEILKPPPSLPE